MNMVLSRLDNDPGGCIYLPSAWNVDRGTAFMDVCFIEKKTTTVRAIESLEPGPFLFTS